MGVRIAGVSAGGGYFGRRVIHPVYRFAGQPSPIPRDPYALPSVHGSVCQIPIKLQIGINSKVNRLNRCRLSTCGSVATLSHY